MPHYVSVFMPLANGDWRALLPDLPSYNVEERSLDLAILRTTGFLEQVIRLGSPVPRPRLLEFIKLDTDWASKEHVDWSHSVVTMIQVHE